MKNIITFIKKLLRKKKTNKTSIDARYIVPRNHHHVSKTEISPNALTVLNRLTSAGYQAYLVGGSVRDLLIRKSPKDFDVSTNATPSQIKRVFKNARIIGRRFKLAHILFHREIIEVATFRGQETTASEQQVNDRGMLIRDNAYGTLEEDAWRRDFTINSLYYDIHDASIVDYTGGFDDIKASLIRMIGDPKTRYHEDPVRMLRAIRFSAKLSFNIEPKTEAPIKPLSKLILNVSNSRLFDEITKLYQCGNGTAVQPLLLRYGLFEHLFPLSHELLGSDYPIEKIIMLALQSTDNRIRDNKPVTPAFIFAVLLWFPLRHRAAMLEQEGLDPLNALEQAMSQIITIQNKIIMVPKRHTQIMREMWLLQFRFPTRQGLRAEHTLEHPRFRAAYDFLALRALADDESIELAQWWTTYQDLDLPEREAMVLQLAEKPIAKKRKRSKSKAKK